jgi:ATP-dependent DNA ligase
VTLPIPRDYPPMEAQPASELPTALNWQYEPKWDGFRCLAFRDGSRVDLESKSGKPLTRYFPEVAEALKRLKLKKIVLDGEIVIPVDGNLSFDGLLMRIHPAESRIAKLSKATPAVYIVFDLLVNEAGKSLVEKLLPERRAELEEFVKKYLKDEGTVRLSPFTAELAIARKWFHMGVGLDGGRRTV